MEKSERTIPLLLQGTPVPTSPGLWRFWLRPGEPDSGVQIQKQIDPKKPVAWRELDKLRSLIEIDYHGTDSGIVGYVTKRAAIKTLRWTGHGQTKVDLSKSRLTELGIDTSGPLELRLPRTLTTLRVTSARHLPKLTIKVDDDGARLELYVWDPRSKVGFIPGLASLRMLTVANVAKVDLAPFAKYTRLKELEVWGVDGGVAITNLAVLAKLPVLERVDLRDTYHTNFAKLPRMPALSLDGIRATDAAHVKKLYAGDKALRMCGVRTDAWLKKNADNPFREWEGPLATRAAKTYRTAVAAVEKKADAEKTLAAFVDAFNKVEKDIDTIMREEIGEAFDALATDLKVPTKKANAWFDRWRDF